MRTAFGGRAAARAPALGDGMYYNIHASPNDGVTNSSVARSGDGIGRGRAAHGPPHTSEIDDRPVRERPWTEQPAIGPQMQYGPLPRRDRPIAGMKPEGEPWEGGEWPRDEWGAYIPPAQLMGLDPKVLEALLEAGKAAGTIAADVTAENMARKRAALEARNVKGHTAYEKTRATAESAAAGRAAAETAREQARASAQIESAKAKTTAWVVLGVITVGGVLGTVLIIRSRGR